MGSNSTIRPGSHVTDVSDARNNIGIDSVPLTHNMRQFFSRMVQQDCAMLWIGDSTSSQGNEPRWGQSLIQQLDVPWVGFVGLGYQTGTEKNGFQEFNAITTVDSGAAFPDASGNNGTVLTALSSTRAGIGDTMMQFYLTRMSYYLAGDWTVGGSLNMAFMVHKPTGSQLTAAGWILYRSDTSAPSYAGSDFSVSTTDGIVVKNFAADTNIGGADNNLRMTLDCSVQVNRYFHCYAVEVYRPSTVGFSLAMYGVGGKTTADWIPSDVNGIGMFTRAQWTTTLALFTRKINTLVIVLGINLASGEADTDAGEAVYKANINTLIDEYVALIETANSSSGSCRVLLVTEWGTSSTDTYARRRARAAFQIAQARSSYVSFMDLDAAMLNEYGSTWHTSYINHSEGTPVHQAVAGVDPIGKVFNKMIWGNASPSARPLIAANPPTAKSVYASGTVYSLTATAAALDFGTTDPAIVLTKPGTYKIRAKVNLKYNAATFAAARTVTLKFRRTNNTAMDLPNSSTAVIAQIVTTLTGTFLVVELPEIEYTTVNVDDAIAVYGSVSVVPTAGSLDCVEASIYADLKQ